MRKRERGRKRAREGEKEHKIFPMLVYLMAKDNTVACGKDIILLSGRTLAAQTEGLQAASVQ